ncbi:unnamed protein product [Fusarium langsethiae]|nr:unnamed protein product [Fusarium langsethiae]
MSVSVSKAPGLLMATMSAISLLIVVLYRGYRARRFYRDMPGLPHSWLLGHIAILRDVTMLMPPNCMPQLYYTEIALRYNLQDIFYLDFWPIGPGLIIITDPKLIEQSSDSRLLVPHPMTNTFMAPMLGEDNTPSKFVFDIVSRLALNIDSYAQKERRQDLKYMRELVDLAEEEQDPRVAYNPIVQIPRRLRRHRVQILVSERIVPSRQNPTSVLDLMLREHVEFAIREKKCGRSNFMRLSRVDEKQFLGWTLLLGGHTTSTNTMSYLFRPERWLDPAKTHPGPAYFRSFGGDERWCPGQNISMYMLKTFLVMTVGDYTFECADL